MITAKQAFEIASRNSRGITLNNNAYDCGDNWVFDYGGNEEITGFCPVMVNKTDGSVNFMDFFESHKLIDFPRVMA